MSWLENCYQTYEYVRQNAPALIGKQDGTHAPLLPVGHTTQQANIQVELDAQGNFLTAFLLRKQESTTIVPCTEESASRTHINPHALADKLQYIAFNYREYGGPKDSGWDAYHEQLTAWCQSRFSHPLVCAVLSYLEKGTLISDLMKRDCLFTDESGKLPTKYSGDEEKKLKITASLTGGDQTESFIRFRVGDDDLWTDPSIWNSWLNFYETRLTAVDYCTVLGKKVPLSSLSPKKIRNPGDSAKLISSNDKSGFTFRGRFSTAEQALSIGYRTTQEAHNALRWLISTQGALCGDETILVWGTQNEPVPQLGDDSSDFAQNVPDYLFANDEDDGFDDEPADSVSTMETIAKQFNRAVRGYRLKLTDTSQLSVIILDSATAGRLSVRYYQELSGSRLLNNVVDWHQTFSWLLEYRSKPEPAEPGKKPKFKPYSFVGAPRPEDIAKAAYGEKVDQKLKQQTVERLVPCIVEQKPLPYDLMQSVVHCATASISLEPWETRKTRNIACALIRGYHSRTKGEDYTMALDENCCDRNYLFGRILACVEQIERYAQNLTFLADDKRTTNAERLEAIFVQRPAATTKLLKLKLRPYLNRIQSKNGSTKRYDLMEELIDRLGLEYFNDKPLNELYLLGYSSQMMQFRRENEAAKKSENAAKND